MDTEKSGDVLDALETPQHEETVMEKELLTKLETPEESMEPEKPPAAAREPEQLPVNGHDTEVMNFGETEEVIVTENVTLSVEKADGDTLPKDESDMEMAPAAVAPTEPDESTEKIPDPVAALDTEPQVTEPEQLSVPENEPEPLHMQAPLAESAPVPEPEKLAESVPEAEPVTLHQQEDTQPLGQEEQMSEQVEAKAEPQTIMDTGAEEAVKEGEAESNAPTEPTEGAQEEKPEDTEKAAAAAEAERAAEMEKAAEIEKAAEAEKEAKAKKAAEMEKAAEAERAAEAKKAVDVEQAEAEVVIEEKLVEPVVMKGNEAAAEGVESELNNAEPEKQEDAVPAAGSLSFAVLEREQTKDTLRTTRTLVVLRGLPGSGKSFLARAIADAYKDICTVVCADDHGVKPESPDTSANGHKALDEAVVACCSAGTASAPVLIVVDDTNHSQDRLARLGEIAVENHLVVVFLEPLTAWSRDPAQLSKKTGRGLEEAQLEAMKGPLEEMCIPLFFGWFLLSSVQGKIACTSMDFLKTLDTLEAFKKHMMDFTGKADKEVDLEQYFESKGSLHCTTKFCNYGKAEGAKEYAQLAAVKEFYGSTFELSLTALFVTPRTVGARVSLTDEQLLLWPADAEKEAESAVPAAASLPVGSRAHATLGCAEGVEPVQTGLDLLEILALQQEGQKEEVVEEMELGRLTYYGEGRWLLSLREPICAPACFSSFYMPKELELTKKEPEKKKKLKCTIL